MGFFRDMAMALRIAARDLRGRARSLWLLVAGVFIGTASVALVGATTQSLIDGAGRGALEAVGGDISLRLSHRPPSEAERAVIASEGAVSITTEVRLMARAPDTGGANGGSVLVELKGVDRNYPLYGTVHMRSGTDLFAALAPQDGMFGAVADPGLYEALGLKPGDSVHIGDARYRLRGVLLAEPDRAFRAFTLGPRIIVANDSLAATGLVSEGAEVYYYTRVRLPEGADGGAEAAAALSRIDRAFPHSGWRMVNAHEGVPGVERTLSMAHVLLLFIGMGVMLVGGAGISGAVRAHVNEKMAIIAILKSVGAPPRVVTMAIGAEILAAAAAGAALGVGVGAFGPLVAATVLADHVPFALDGTPAVEALLAAGLFGILVAALFAWWPLMGVYDLQSQALLRRRFNGPPLGSADAKRWFGAGVILAAIIAVIAWVSPMPALTAAFLVGALVLATIYFALGIGLARFAKAAARGRGAHMRLALGNLHRAGAPTGPVVMALGLSLTVLVALDGIGTAASRHVQDAMPRTAPDLVAFSLQPETAARLDAELKASELVRQVRIMPFLHARVQAINGVAVRDLDIPGSLNWVVRGDRGVSFAEGLMPAGRAGFSVDAVVASKLGLEIGDRVTVNVGGHVREAPILDLRDVDWTTLDLDFPIIASPETFEGIPYTYAAALKAAAGQAPRLEAFIKDRFDRVPVIRVADVLASLAAAMAAIVSGLQTAALMCGLVAMVVLAGSVLQGIRTRVEEAVLFKVLGARRQQLLGQLALEFLALGVLVALVAVPLGLAIAYGVVVAAGLASVTLSLSGALAHAVAALLVTLVVGLAATAGAYTTSPARLLRGRRM